MFYVLYISYNITPAIRISGQTEGQDRNGLYDVSLRKLSKK